MILSLQPKQWWIWDTKAWRDVGSSNKTVELIHDHGSFARRLLIGKTEGERTQSIPGFKDSRLVLARIELPILVGIGEDYKKVVTGLIWLSPEMMIVERQKHQVVTVMDGVADRGGQYKVGRVWNWARSLGSRSELNPKQDLC